MPYVIIAVIITACIIAYLIFRGVVDQIVYVVLAPMLSYPCILLVDLYVNKKRIDRNRDVSAYTNVADKLNEKIMEFLVTTDPIRISAEIKRCEKSSEGKFELKSSICTYAKQIEVFLDVFYTDSTDLRDRLRIIRDYVLRLIDIETDDIVSTREYISYGIYYDSAYEVIISALEKVPSIPLLKVKEMSRNY